MSTAGTSLPLAVPSRPHLGNGHDKTVVLRLLGGVNPATHVGTPTQTRSSQKPPVVAMSPFDKQEAATRGNAVIWPKKQSRTPKLPAPKLGSLTAEHHWCVGEWRPWGFLVPTHPTPVSTLSLSVLEPTASTCI